MKYLKKYENPDSLTLTGKYLVWFDDYAFPFGYYDDKMYVGDEGVSHSSIFNDDDNNNNNNLIRTNFTNCGRIWVKYKVISFWDYPDNYNDLMIVLKEIEENYNKFNEHIKIDDNWLIEVIFNNDEQLINKDKYWRNNFSKLIKVRDYKGSAKRSEKELILNHIKIGSGGKITGFGSDYYNDNNKLPIGMSQSEYRNKKTKYKFTENMKKFEEFLNEKKLQDWKIYVDMDGVLTDFDRQLKIKWLNKYNKDNDTNFKDGWSFEEKVGKDEFWLRVNEIGLNFWSDMPWKNDGKKLWNFIKNKNTEILSTPSKDKESEEGKKIWCDRELDVKPILSNKKEEFANNKSILIDDLKENIEKWNNAGGVGILHKDTESTIKKLTKIFNKE